VLQTTTDNDRRQRAKQYWPRYTTCRLASNNWSLLSLRFTLSLELTPIISSSTFFWYRFFDFLLTYCFIHHFFLFWFTTLLIHNGNWTTRGQNELADSQLTHRSIRGQFVWLGPTVCTVVQDCCKGRSNKYRKWHFWGSCRPETPLPINMKFGMDDYVRDTTRHPKWHVSRIRGVTPTNGWNVKVCAL